MRFTLVLAAAVVSAQAESQPTKAAKDLKQNVETPIELRTVVTWDEECLKQGGAVKSTAVKKAAKVMLVALSDDATTTKDPVSGEFTTEEVEAGEELKSALVNKKVDHKAKNTLVRTFVEEADSEVEKATKRRLLVETTDDGRRRLSEKESAFQKRDEVIGVLKAFSKGMEKAGVGKDDDDGEFFGHIGVDVLPANRDGKQIIAKTAQMMPCVKFAEQELPREPLGTQNDVNTIYDHLDHDWWVHSYYHGDPVSTFQWYFGANPGVGHLKTMEYLKKKGITIPEGLPVAVVDAECNYNFEDINWEVNEDEIPDNGKDDDNNNIVDDYKGYVGPFSSSSSFSLSILLVSCFSCVFYICCQDFGGGDSDTSVKSGKPHGSTVSAIIAAKSYNKCKIVCYKAARQGVLYTSLILKAINAIIDRGDIRVSNHSYGGFGPLQSEFQAFKKLDSSGHLIVTAAGNSGCDMTTSNSCNSNGVAMVPAMYDLQNIVSVGAIDINNMLSWFSNYGDNVVDLWAPGNIIVAFNSPQSPVFHFSRGTSYAAPIVTGAAALAMSLDPNLSGSKVRQLLYSTSRVTHADQTTWGAHGQLDMLQLIKAIV
ncbi:MAG: hypothetical protein KVP17_001050 [Porospora cf. gigantea B]|uniref:uncharacterized protein n=1 Tax=Porospora cf. gigantea B TaxID=2853592 RepID=UPI003571C01D|nr:MAG: hypothetical protein KVP17_001050 [Porospora cf. gigantea B]